MTDKEQLASILAEWHQLRAAGTELDVDELVRSHPELEEELRANLAAMEFLDRAFDEPAPPEGAPRTIGPYRIVQEIGRGGMGVVYEAEQVSMHRRVALKVLAPSLTSTGRSVQRFKSEARAAGRLHHTNIVPVHDMGQHGGHWYYAMEFVEGWPLSRMVAELRASSDRASRCRLQVEKSAATALRAGQGSAATARSAGWCPTIASMFAGVAEALQVAHDERIVHRDVKPGNLLLHNDGTLKLVDFGLAHLDDNGPAMTRTGDVLGTPAYMSPEQAAARRQRVDHRTDIYSLGATLYEVLTLRPPFEGESLAELCTKIASREPAHPRRLAPEIPKDLETIVLKAMEKEPHKRYATAGDFARDLRAFCDGGSVRARRVGLATRVVRRIRRHKVPSALTAVAMALAIGGGAIAWRLHSVEQATEYERLIAQAKTALPSSGESGPSFARLLQDAIVVAPDRPEAYWLRAMASGDVEARLRDVAAALARGLEPGAASWLRAYMLCEAGRMQEARAESRRAASYPDEDSAVALYARARFADSDGDVDSAVALLSRAIRLAADGAIVRYLALRTRSRIYRNDEQLEGALNDLIALRSLGDESPQLQMRIAVLWRRFDRRREAEEAFEQALNSARAWDDPRAWRLTVSSCTTGDAPEWLERAAAACIKACAAQLERNPLAADAQQALATTLSATGRHDEALDAYERLTEIAPRSPSAWNNLGGALYRLQRYDDAAVAFDEAIALRPWSPSTHNNRGLVLSRANRHADAIAAFQVAIAQRPSDDDYHRRLGDAHMSAGQVEEAIVAYRSAAKLERRGSTAVRKLAAALAQAGRPQEAIETLRGAAASNPTDARLLQALGELSSAARQLSEFVGFLGVLASQNPDDAELHFHLGVAQSQLGRDEAEASFRRAIDLDPGMPMAHHNLGAQLAKDQRWAEAALCFEQAVRLNSDDIRAVYALADTYYQLGQYADQAAVLRRAAILKPDDLGTHLRIVNALAMAGLEDEVAAAVPATLEAVRNDALACKNLGGILCNAGFAELAIPVLERAIELEPNLVSAQFNLGNALLEEERWEESIDSLRRALELQPDHHRARINLGGALRQASRYDEAIIELRRAIVSHPEDIFAHQNLSITLRKQGRVSEAVEAARQAVALAPDASGPLYTLAVGLRQHGEIEAAREGLWRIVERDPEYWRAHYLLACMHAVAKQPDVAFACLSRAVDAGWSDTEKLQREPDLESLRTDPRYRALLERKH